MITIQLTSVASPLMGDELLWQEDRFPGDRQGKDAPHLSINCSTSTTSVAAELNQSYLTLIRLAITGYMASIMSCHHLRSGSLRGG